MKASAAALVIAGMSTAHAGMFDDEEARTQILQLRTQVTETQRAIDQRVAELGEIDSALLADELPISAFTDIGFDAWLKHNSSQ